MSDDSKKDTPEEVFEDVVAEKYPDAYQPEVPEEIPAEIADASEVDRPSASVLDDVPQLEHNDGKMKYLFIGVVVLVFIVVFFSLLALFNRTGTSAPEAVTLTYWGIWEDEIVFKPVFDEYMKANPHVTIKYIKNAPRDYLSLIKARSLNGVGPDIFRFHNTWIHQLIGKDTANTYLQSIPSTIMTTAEYEKTFHSIHQRDFGVNGKYYAIPLYVDNLVMIYNPEMLKNAGFVSPPRQWSGELQTQTSSMTVRGPNDTIVTAGIALGTSNNVEHFSDIYGLLMLVDVYQSTKDITQSKMKPISVLTDPAKYGEILRSALMLYRSFAENGDWSPQMPNSIDAFAQGKVGIIFGYSWQIPIIKAKNPDIKLAVASIPEDLNGSKLSVASYWAEGVSPFVPANRQHEAWKLLKFLSSEASQQKIYDAQVKLRGVGTAFSRTDMKTKLNDNPYLAPIVGQIDVSVSLPLNTRTYDKGLNDELITYVGKAIDTTAEGVSYDASRDSLIKGIDQVMQKYKLSTGK